MTQYFWMGVLCVASVVHAASPEIVSYAVGGAGGIVPIGQHSVGMVVGQPLGSIVAVGDDSALVGYWTVVSQSQESTPVRAMVYDRGIDVRIAGLRAEVAFTLSRAADAQVRVLAADGSLLETTWKQALPAGSSQTSIDLSGLPAQAAFIVIEAGAERKTLQFNFRR